MHVRCVTVTIIANLKTQKLKVVPKTLAGVATTSSPKKYLREFQKLRKAKHVFVKVVFL